MKEDVLVNILNDESRAKLMRFFSMNRESAHPSDEIMSILDIKKEDLTKQLRSLEKNTIITQRKLTQREKKEKNTRMTKGYMLNKRYKFLQTLDRIIIQTLPKGKDSLCSKVMKVKGVKFILNTGVFTNARDASVDILIAGTDINEGTIKTLIKETEKEMGVEIRYIILSSNELTYRIQIRDKFIRELLDGDYEIYLDRNGILRE